MVLCCKGKSSGSPFLILLVPSRCLSRLRVRIVSTVTVFSSVKNNYTGIIFVKESISSAYFAPNGHVSYSNWLRFSGKVSFSLEIGDGCFHFCMSWKCCQNHHITAPCRSLLPVKIMLFHICSLLSLLIRAHSPLNLLHCFDPLIVWYNSFSSIEYGPSQFLHQFQERFLTGISSSI